jgi:type I restriction enzyme S subunit
MKLTVDRKVTLPLFYYYVFASSEQQKHIRLNTIQTGVPHINLGILKCTPVQRPPLCEQEAIAGALNDADALVESLEQLIAKKRYIKQGTMQELLTGKKRLPGFSGERHMKPLAELGTWKGGMTPSMQNPSYWAGGTVPWVSSGDVKSVLLTATASLITDEAVKHGKTTLLPPKSIVIVTRSGILRKYLPVAMNVVAMAINQDIKALIPNDGYDALYLLHLLIGHGNQILASCLKAGTTVESVEFSWLKGFIVPIPPTFAEQVAIAAVLSDMDAEIAALEAKLAKAREIKQGMMYNLLTGRIRLV